MSIIIESINGWIRLEVLFSDECNKIYTEITEDRDVYNEWKKLPSYELTKNTFTELVLLVLKGGHKYAGN